MIVGIPAEVIVSGTLIAGVAGVAFLCDVLRGTNDRLRKRVAILEALWEEERSRNRMASFGRVANTAPVRADLRQARLEMKQLLDRVAPRTATVSSRPEDEPAPVRTAGGRNWNALLDRGADRPSAAPIPIDARRAANE